MNNMDINLIEKPEITVAELLEATINCNPTALIVESCFKLDYTLNILKHGRLNSFEPVMNIDESDLIITTVSEFDEPYDRAITLEKFREFCSKLKNDNCYLQREIEDGCTFANTEAIIVTSDLIIIN